MLKKFSMEQSKRGYVPMSSGFSLSKSMCLKTQDARTCMIMTPYASALGSIMYVMLCSGPDVSYALGVSSIYQSDPRRVIRWLSRISLST